ncbi:MAG TPA: DUF4301 family protein, partial [Flavobacterium sp.]|nr:DUF4301 family protein [Flavobacterium sp.]
MEENLKQQAADKIKIALYGPESTGKTTLARQLASYFSASWVPEFARNYLQKKWDETNEACAPEDLIPIAVGQMKLENEALGNSGNYLFCDTNLMCTKVFSEIYYGYCYPVLDKAARKHSYDLFFLTGIDVPFEKDDLRDRPEEREMLFEKFERALIENQKPYVILSGNREERLDAAVSIIEEYARAKALGFSACDFIQIHRKGLKVAAVEKHLSVLDSGVPKAVLEKPASLQDGILPLSESEAARYAALFDSKKENLKLQKFVPASGAASRMFKFLAEFLNDFKLGKETVNAYINRKRCASLPVFLIGKEKLPFYKQLLDYTESAYPLYSSWDNDTKNYHLIKSLLDHGHLNF